MLITVQSDVFRLLILFNHQPQTQRNKETNDCFNVSVTAALISSFLGPTQQLPSNIRTAPQSLLFTLKVLEMNELAAAISKQVGKAPKGNPCL